MKNGRLIVFSAPSGAGKTTLVKHVIEEGFPLLFSVSATTRAPRENEVDGKDYYFISREEFQSKQEQGLFLEWQEVYDGIFYGTLQSEIERIWAGGNHVIFDVDVQGGMNIKKMFPRQTLSIFVMPPSLEELTQRLRNRKSESEEQLRQRIEKATFELQYADEFDYILVNDDLEIAKVEAVSLVSDFICL